jgi:hypothetical protein
MRVTKTSVAVTIGVLLVTTSQAQENKGTQMMAQARKALGGEQKLAAVKALSLRATYQREMSLPGMTGGGRAMVRMEGGGGGPAMGDNSQITGEIEVDVELPAKYIKVDTSTGFMAMTRTEGFDGDRPFAHAAAANPGMRIQIDQPGADPERLKMALQRNQAELARLLLGILATAQPSFPVSYSYAGIAESADGKADMIDVKGPDNFAARLYLDVQTHLPLMLTYMAPEPRIVMSTVDRGNADAERERVERERQQAEEAPPKLVEYRLFFSDYRDVGDLSLPHHIARGTAQKATEQWEVKSYKINPTLKADRFKVS